MQDLLERLKDDIRVRGLSIHTEHEYIERTQAFLKWCNKPEKDLTEHDIRGFLKHLINDTELKCGTINTYNSSLRFFFGVTLDRALNYKQIPRMKHRRTFPDILTKSEVRQLLDKCDNLRDKSLLMLMYGSGLRVSEVVSLKTIHIDSKTMRVYVYCGKGGKDRFTILSQECLETLREYWQACKPKDWLFPSRAKKDNLNHITPRSARNVVEKHITCLSTHKNITAHSLRQAFATHLFEDGVNAVDIKNLLGHVNIQTTTFYLNVADVRSGVKSPLDTLPKKRGRTSKTNSGDTNA